MTDSLVVPSTSQFRDALKNLWNRHLMSTKFRTLLKAQYAAPGHTMTTTELAAAAEYENYSAVNLQYGSFSERLAKKMKWDLPFDTHASELMVTFIKPGDDVAHWRWVMRPEVVGALEELGWVKKNAEE